MITPEICAKVGRLNARMHLAAEEGMSLDKVNEFGPVRWCQWVAEIGEKFSKISERHCEPVLERREAIQLAPSESDPGLFRQPDGRLTMTEENVEKVLNDLLSNWPAGLPKGVIHGDLFPDNVFFDAEKICGVIDFHFVCSDFFAYDLAITINAWCFAQNNQFVQERYDNMLQAYEAVRPLFREEKEALPLLLQAVALRFFLSRAEELLAYTSDIKMKPKDPLAFWQRLQFFQNFAQQQEVISNAAC